MSWLGGIFEQVNAYKEEMGKHNMSIGQISMVDGEQMAPSSTPQGIRKFKELYDKVKSELSAMGYAVNELPSYSLATHTPLEIEERQRKALEYLQDIFKHQGRIAMPTPMPNSLPTGVQRSPVTTAKPPQSSAPIMTDEDAYKLLYMRLRIFPRADSFNLPSGGFKALSICQDTNKTYVFVVSDGGPAVLEDEPHLFPSDALIAALNLLRG